GGEHGAILGAGGRSRRRPGQPLLSYHCSISQREIDSLGDSSRPSAAVSPRSAAPISSRANQRASSSSASAGTGASGSASATKPSISDEGKGQGCEAR